MQHLQMVLCDSQIQIFLYSNLSMDVIFPQYSIVLKVIWGILCIYLKVGKRKVRVDSGRERETHTQRATALRTTARNTHFLFSYIYFEIVLSAQLSLH